MILLADAVAVDPSDAISQVQALVADLLPYVITFAVAGIAMMLVRRWLVAGDGPEPMTEEECYAECRMMDDMEREDEVMWQEMEENDGGAWVEAAARQDLLENDGEHWVAARDAEEMQMEFEMAREEGR
jgi:hypothetical protein